MTKNRIDWHEVFFKTHPKFNGPLKHILDVLIYGREADFSLVVDTPTRDYPKDITRLRALQKSNHVTLETIRDTSLPFRTIEEYVSKEIDTTWFSLRQA